MPLTSSGLVLWTSLVGIVSYGSFVLLRFFLRILKLNQFVKNFPNQEKHWLLGNLDQFPGLSEAGLTWMKERSAEYPEGIGLFWMGPFYPTINVARPETVKAILNTSEPKPLKMGAYFNIRPWLGDGLLLAGGKKWERNRQLLTPAFHVDILKPYMDINNRCADIFINKLEKFAERDEFFEAFTHTSLLTLDIILRCVFSYENDFQLRGESHPYVKAVDSLSETAMDRLLKPWLYPNFVFYLTSQGRQFKRECEYVHSVSEEVIRKRKEALVKTSGRLDTDSCKKNRYLDLVDILLTAKDSDGQGLTDKEIRDEADTFLFEGHDTTMSGISWTLYSLAKHPEHMRRCQEEVDQVLKGKTKTDIEWDDLPKLKYLTLCMKESMRINTIIPIIQRQTTKDMTIDGRHIPAGVIINIHLYVLHHNPEVWMEPEEYRPERFSPENIGKMDPHAFAPFSAGPRSEVKAFLGQKQTWFLFLEGIVTRGEECQEKMGLNKLHFRKFPIVHIKTRNCIGQHLANHLIKCVVAKIISKFDISLDPSRTVKQRLGMMLKSEDGIHLKATPRKSSSSDLHMNGVGHH